MVKAQLIMSETVGREVVCQTTCYENTYASIDSSEIVFEISKVAKQAPMYIGPGAKEDTVETIDAVLDIVTGFCAIGAVMPIPPANLVFGAVAACAGLIQFGISIFAPDKEDPVKKAMEKLTQKLKELDEKTMARFADMKLFITENQLNIDIINEIATMKKFMVDCVEYGNKASIENFRSAYERHTPLELAYTLMCLLSQQSTNPLMMAMAKDRTVLTFDKWEKVIRAIIGDLMLLEAFGAGLLRNKESINDWNLLWELKDEALGCLSQWRKDYRAESYWSEMHTFMKTYTKDHTHLTNEQKADEIARRLNSYLTDDQFYVFIFNECNINEEVTMYCPKLHNQTINCWNEGKCNALIYRSLNAHKMKDADYERIRNEVNSCRYNKLENPGSIDRIIETQLITPKIISEYGFVALIKHRRNLQIRSANLAGKPEPGCWIDAYVKEGQYKIDMGYSFIASFD